MSIVTRNLGKLTKARSRVKPLTQPSLPLCFSRHVFRSYLGRVFKTGEAAEEGKIDVAGGAVALFGDEKVDRKDIRVLGRIFFLLAAFLRIGFVEEPDQVGVLLDGAGF